MATKKQIAEQAMRILAGGHLKPDRNLDIREMMLALDQLRDSAVSIHTLNNIKAGEYGVDADFLSVHDNVAVSADTSHGLRYITLPGSPISLPHDMGIYQISPMKNQEDVYHRIAAGALAIYKRKQSLTNQVNTYYWNIGTKVYFKNLDISVDSLLLIMAKSSKDILETETYPVPPDVEIDLLQRLVEMFSMTKQIPHDEVEDGQK